MQEGTLALMQLAKTVAALERLRAAGVPFISVLSDPTTGGVFASFAAIGDVNVAEPNALIGFAGARVTSGTIAQELPPGFQRSEFLFAHGFLDRVVHRSELRAELAALLSYLVPGAAARNGTSDEPEPLGLPSFRPLSFLRTHGLVMAEPWPPPATNATTAPPRNPPPRRRRSPRAWPPSPDRPDERDGEPARPGGGERANARRPEPDIPGHVVGVAEPDRPRCRRALAAQPEQLVDRHAGELSLKIVEGPVDPRDAVWARVQQARNLRRPRTLELVNEMAEDFIEIHGDRLFGDDEAIVTGFARLDGRRIVVIGQQKGTDTEENIRRFPGCPPEGYRRRCGRWSSRAPMPVVTFVDVPGAHPGAESEERGIAGQSPADRPDEPPPDADRHRHHRRGGSGGALAIAVADVVIASRTPVLQISPGLRRDPVADGRRAPTAAAAMRMTAAEQQALGVVDTVVEEPGEGATPTTPRPPAA